MTALEVITHEPIGVIRTPYTDREGMPIQPAAAEGVRGTIELRPELADGLKGLKDLDGFSHIILLYQRAPTVLPKVLDAASRFAGRPADADMAAMAEVIDLQPVFS